MSSRLNSSVVLVVAALTLATGCATTTRTMTRHVMTTSAPAHPTYRILGVTLEDGMALGFTEPATTGRNEAGEPVLFAGVPTGHPGGKATASITIRIAEIETFWLEYSDEERVDETGKLVASTVAVVGAGVILDAIFQDWH